MSADRMEEFETGEDEPWYGKQDLEQDLYLAAELGKSLLERNRELEDSLQFMYLTNEEQGQEIEYLSKQLETLREINEQHAKVYEQLDVAAHKLELTNKRLVLEDKASQQKIERLTRTMVVLQGQVDMLTARVEELRLLEQLRVRCEKRERHKTIHSIPCLKELCTMTRDENGFLVGNPGSKGSDLELHSLEEENEYLREAISSLQSSMRSERTRCEGAEREYAIGLQQSACLEQRLMEAEACRQHMQELEAEVQELQQLRRARAAAVCGEDGVLEEEVAAETEARAKDGESSPVHKSRSETALSAFATGDAPGRRQGGYVLHGDGGRRQGMSILREVDEQYHALLERYEELLGRCRRSEEGRHHAGVQTSRPVSRDSSMKDCCAPAPLLTPEAQESISNPREEVDIYLGQNTADYKVLFKEIFSHIQKTKTNTNSTKAGKTSK